MYKAHISINFVRLIFRFRFRSWILKIAIPLYVFVYENVDSYSQDDNYILHLYKIKFRFLIMSYTFDYISFLIHTSENKLNKLSLLLLFFFWNLIIYFHFYNSKIFILNNNFLHFEIDFSPQQDQFFFLAKLYDLFSMYSMTDFIC